MRIALIGKKLGMTQVTENGVALPVTLVQVTNHDVFGIKNNTKHGYNAIILSAGGVAKEKNVSKPLLSQYKKLGINPARRLFEVRVESESDLESYKVVDQSILDDLEGTFVDVSACSIGKGFAGGMKRHNFKGLEASHGVSVSHRAIGATGQCQDPGRVFKGKKMPGQYGNVMKTIQNLRIIQVDNDLGVIAIYGAVPGSKNSYVMINDAVKMGRQHMFSKVNNVNLVFKNDNSSN